MGMIGRILAGLFGGGRNAVAQTAEVFRVNAEASAQRQADYAQAALSQFGAEFQFQRKGWFDRFVDGLNRLPRPLMVMATFALFSSAMFDPLWFAERMQGLALVPEPLWWLAGTIVAFYFGGRFQTKDQEFKKSVAHSTTVVPQVLKNISQLRSLRHNSPGVASTRTDSDLTVQSIEPSQNAAVHAWQVAQRNV